MDIEIVTEVTILEEVGKGLEKSNTQIILEGIIEVIAVGQHQAEELVVTEIELDVLSVGDMVFG